MTKPTRSSSSCLTFKKSKSNCNRRRLRRRIFGGINWPVPSKVSKLMKNKHSLEIKVRVHPTTKIKDTIVEHKWITILLLWLQKLCRNSNPISKWRHHCRETRMTNWRRKTRKLQSLSNKCKRWHCSSHKTLRPPPEASWSYAKWRNARLSHWTICRLSLLKAKSPPRCTSHVNWLIINSIINESRLGVLTHAVTNKICRSKTYFILFTRIQ